MKNRSLALSAILVAALTCLSPLHAANYLSSLARLHQNFVQLTDILSTQEAPSSEAAIADLKRQFGAQEPAKTQPTLSQQQIQLALERSRQEQIKREKKAQALKKETIQHATASIPLDKRITTIEVGAVQSIRQDKSAQLSTPTGQNWKEMLAAIRDTNSTVVKKLLPLFGYYPGGAKTRSGETLLQVLEKARGKSETDKAPIRVLLNSILFYDSQQPFYEFTNFYQAPITIDGVTWSCTEAFYQAQKFNWDDKDAQDFYQTNFVAQAATLQPSEAFRRSKTPQAKQYIDPSWQKRSLDVMRQALEAKFTQNPALKLSC